MTCRFFTISTLAFFALSYKIEVYVKIINRPMFYRAH